MEPLVCGTNRNIPFHSIPRSTLGSLWKCGAENSINHLQTSVRRSGQRYAGLIIGLSGQPPVGGSASPGWPRIRLLRGGEAVLSPRSRPAARPKAKLRLAGAALCVMPCMLHTRSPELSQKPATHLQAASPRLQHVPFVSPHFLRVHMSHCSPRNKGSDLENSQPQYAGPALRPCIQPKLSGGLN